MAMHVVSEPQITADCFNYYLTDLSQYLAVNCNEQPQVVEFMGEEEVQDLMCNQHRFCLYPVTDQQSTKAQGP